MLEILYHGKKDVLDKELTCRIEGDVKAGKKVTLLVPEQQVHGAETMLSYHNVMSPELEVVGFRRLCESIFRRFGGLAYNNITDGARLVLMWRTLSEISSMLKEYGSVALDDIDMIKSLLSSVNELSLYAVSPKDLEDVAKRINAKNPRLARKIEDLSLIAATNSAILKNSYNDPAEDTKRALETLKDNDYFGGRTVYVAHFLSFTVYEKRMIAHIVKKADDTFAFIGMNKGDSRDIFDGLRKTRDAFLKSAAENGIKTVQTQLDSMCSDRPTELDYFAENIWNFSAKKYAGRYDAIRIFEAPSARDEAKFVASEIAKKVREGGVRYRDFSVVVRNTADYEGIIDTALKDFGIPCFISSKTDIKIKASIKMLLLALKIRSHRWQTDDVVSYMKCGFSGLSEDACDKLERYATLWKISGRRWFDEHPWSMHPRGFGAEMKDGDRLALDELNSYRQILVSPLVKFFEIFEKDPTLCDVSMALYKYLEEISLRKNLDVYAAELRNAGRISEADETVQIWNALMDSLDSLVAVAGDMRCNSSAYLKLLSASLEMSSIGKIPSGIDEVFVGEPTSLRAAGVKYAYVIGVCDGIFPAALPEDSILGDRDRRELALEGIELSEESSEGVKDEMFYFYLAGLSAQKELTFTYNNEKNKSNFIYSLTSLFDKLEPQKTEDMDNSEFVWSDMSALEYALEKREQDMDSSEEIRKYLEDRGNIGFFRETDLINGEYRYTGEKRLFGDRIRLSQTRLESYALCPFAYYCQYVLGISQDPEAEASYADIGTFAHSFLEAIVPKLSAKATSFFDGELTRIFEETFAECENSLGDYLKDPSVRGLVGRLKNMLALATENLVGELASSDFKPSFYELDIGGDLVAPMTIELPDGTQAVLYGKIDRVDTYNSDGDVYVKIVDYKTGEKIFNRDQLEYGINMQMLLYLESVCASDSKELRKKLGAPEDSTLIPAGVVYLSTKMPKAPGVPDGELDEKKITDEAALKLERAGLLINDEDIISAMDRTKSGKYVPVSFTKTGKISASSAKKSLVDSFDEIFDSVNSTVAHLTSGMKSGKADATPLKIKKKDACEHCDMAPICRRKQYCEENSDVFSDDDEQGE